MITFKNIKYKNFLSTGNNWTEIDFQQYNTNLIIGTNGAGKSSMLDALTFVLFNKPFRKINKPQLINTTNERECLVEIEFSVNSRDYLVRRGIKPNVFDIEVNGNPLHKEADDRANQRILEERGNANINANQEKINSLDAEVLAYMKENSILEEDVFKFIKEQESVIGAGEKLVKLNNLKGKLSQKVGTITKEHKFFTENTVCPTCTQDIEEEFRLNKIVDVQNRAKELQSGYQELETTIKFEQEKERQFNSLSKEITKLNNGISQNNTRVSGCQRQIRDLESEIQRLTQQVANRNTEHEKLAEFKVTLQNTIEDLSDKRIEMSNYDFAYSLLKDDGVKTKIIKKYIPFINQQVNRYLQMMDFYINFNLDGEFNETVKSPIHEDFSYASFSEGEKMRIDLALLFTWREVARVKNSVNTNLLIMDEVFDSSLDGFGTEEFLKIIKYVIKGANIFVISHKSDLHDKFDNVIKFDKIKGFSKKVS